MQKKYCLSSILCLLLSFVVNAQSVVTYRSLQEALQEPDSVCRLVLKRQGLKSFPKEIFSFKNLEYLDLSFNELDSLPKDMTELPKLHYLSLAQNNISSLPCCLSSFALDSLVLWGNTIRSFDSCFSNLKLKYLDIRAIQMTRKEQKAIIAIFPGTRIRKDHPCNCGDRKE